MTHDWTSMRNLRFKFAKSRQRSKIIWSLKIDLHTSLKWLDAIEFQWKFEYFFQIVAPL
jgi:hypothetical protein